MAPRAPEIFPVELRGGRPDWHNAVPAAAFAMPFARRGNGKAVNTGSYRHSQIHTDPVTSTWKLKCFATNVFRRASSKTEVRLA